MNILRMAVTFIITVIVVISLGLTAVRLLRAEREVVVLVAPVRFSMVAKDLTY